MKYFALLFVFINFVLVSNYSCGPKFFLETSATHEPIRDNQRTQEPTYVKCPQRSMDARKIASSGLNESYNPFAPVNCVLYHELQNNLN